MKSKFFLHRRFFDTLQESFRKNRLLWLALFFCFGLSLIGAQWGKVEDWNPDQMAFKGVPNNLMVGNYLKPPLTTYVARMLVLNPVDIVMHGILHTNNTLRLEVRVLCVRILTILYLCAAVALVYCAIGRCYGKDTASVVALIMGTSAGLVSYTHYGTADMPLLFWMIASFVCALYAALSGRLMLGMAAGLLAGLATACKYNGLGVAVAIPIFFLLQEGPQILLKTKFWLARIWHPDASRGPLQTDTRRTQYPSEPHKPQQSHYKILVVGLLFVPIGFVLGCPGAIFDRAHFVQDFLYNLYTTPVYSGDTSHAGYGLFLNYIPSVVGWPVTLFLAVCVGSSILLLLLRRLNKNETLVLVGTLGVFFFYFFTIGRFPRIEMRFVMPIVPFLLIAAAPALSRIHKKLLITVVILLVAYNVLCSLLLGWRFWDDPKMDACSWAEKNFQVGTVIESSQSPCWQDLIPGLQVIQMPLYTGQSERFKKIFGENSVISQGAASLEDHSSLEMFTDAALEKRDPDYITFSSFAILWSGDPLAQQYYKDHLDEKLGYHLVWQKTYWLPPQWAYPQEVDFLTPAMYILKRDEKVEN